MVVAHRRPPEKVSGWQHPERVPDVLIQTLVNEPREWESHRFSGGLRSAATTGYYLPALQAENPGRHTLIEDQWDPALPRSVLYFVSSLLLFPLSAKSRPRDERLLLKMLTGRDIIYISSIEWNFLWQPTHEIAVRLARAGNRVLYIENTGVRAPGLGDAGRVLTRLKSWVAKLGTSGVREVAPNVYVCSPLVLPPFGSGLRKLINRHLLLPLIRRTAQKLKMRDVLLWTHLPTDTVLDLIKLLQTENSATVYYCLADFPQLTPDSDLIVESERELVKRSDVVFANCTQISERLSAWKDRVDVFPPGVDLEMFPAAAAEDGSARATNEWQSLPRPVIGYIGGLHRHVDFDLIADMAEARPAWSWVLVGPLQASAERLQGRPNIYLAGPRQHHELPRHLGSFDVCIVPYLQSAYTETVVPTKINEYLAAGKPIVSTNLPTVLEFNERHHILTTTGNNRDDFLRSIEAVLQLPNDPETIARRREVAALCDWKVQIEAMSKLIENKLEQKRAEARAQFAGAKTN